MSSSGKPTPERKYALRRIKAGDYIFFGNDQTTLWRVHTYEDGPSFWAIRRWETPIVLGQTAIEIENWDRWEFVEGFYDKRQGAIDGALKLEGQSR